MRRVLARRRRVQAAGRPARRGSSTTIETHRQGRPSSRRSRSELDARAGRASPLLTEVVSGLKIDDTTARTRILEGISAAFAQQNRARATIEGRYKELSAARRARGVRRAVQAARPERSPARSRCATRPSAATRSSRGCSSRSRSSRAASASSTSSWASSPPKREEVVDAIGARRQPLARRAPAPRAEPRHGRGADPRGRRAPRQTFTTADELNAYFAADAMVQKLGDLAAQLRALGDDPVAPTSSSRGSSPRGRTRCAALRDKADLFEDGGDVIKLGEHRFTVNTQPLELMIVPRDDGARAPPDRHRLLRDRIERRRSRHAKDLWDQTLVSENARRLSRRVPGGLDAARRRGRQVGPLIEALSRAMIGVRGRELGAGEHRRTDREVACWSASARTPRTASTRATSAACTTPTRR